MTDEDATEKRLNELLNASRRAYRQPQTDGTLERPSSNPPLKEETPLADLLEHVIRDRGLGERERFDPPQGVSEIALEPNLLHQKLIEELHTAQKQVRAEPSLEYATPPEEAVPAVLAVEQAPAPLLDAIVQPQHEAPQRLIEELQTAQSEQNRVWAEPPLEYAGLPDEHLSLQEPAPTMFGLDETLAPLPDAVPETRFEPSASRESKPEFHDMEETARVSPAEPLNEDETARSRLAIGASALVQHSQSLGRRMRLQDWRRRRLALLSIFHRHVFDRNTEKLLFCKTPPLEVYQTEETESGPEKSFIYQGPIPRKLLDWALSALPADLKHYAFVDFRAGNGRTLLLAARRNFEYAAGYAFDAENSETLEMNLAQYPRSYLSCRDVRALRGDRDGVVIPSQPAVLFFPDSLSFGHLEIILSYVTASLRVDPRPIYLIFENAGREFGSEHITFFEKITLPLINQAKAFLFGPIGIAVYRSKIESAD